MTVSPLARVVFLLVVAIGVFFIPRWWQCGAVLAAIVALWFAARLPARRLWRHLVKLWGLALFLVLSFGFFSDGPATDRWVSFEALWGLRINAGGLEEGGAMFLRLLTVVLVSQLARAGDAKAIAAGLARLGVPARLAKTIDVVLLLLGDDGRHGEGRGRGRGTGGGRTRGEGRGGGGGSGGGDGQGRRGRSPGASNEPSDEDRPREGLLVAARRLARGDVRPIVGALDRHLERARREAGGDPGGDAGVVAGVALTMLGIKALKVLPNLPFAPGHKLVLLNPLYVVAATRTRGPLGATWTGATMGTVAFLMGDGKYGIFEIAKHVAPGVICDVGVPLLVRGGRRPGLIAWSLFGALVALGRYATIFAVVLMVQPPSTAWALLVPGSLVHGTFGLVSGLATAPLLRALDQAVAVRDGDPSASSASSASSVSSVSSVSSASSVSLEEMERSPYDQPEAQGAQGRQQGRGGEEKP